MSVIPKKVFVISEEIPIEDFIFFKNNIPNAMKKQLNEKIAQPLIENKE
jgi:hypothetical protein